MDKKSKIVLGSNLASHVQECSYKSGLTPLGSKRFKIVSHFPVFCWLVLAFDWFPILPTYLSKESMVCIWFPQRIKNKL